MRYVLFMTVVLACSNICCAQFVRSSLGAMASSFMQEESKNLPEGLTAVEYLESDGNQYIEVGPITGTVALELAIATTEIPESGCNKGCGIGFSANFQDDMGVNTSGWNGQYPCEINVPIIYRIDNVGFWFNGTKINGNPVWFTDKIASGKFFMLFCGSNGSRAYRTSSGNYRAWRGRIYECKLVGESGLIRYLIPVKEGEGDDVVGGLYDLVTGDLFVNNGQGNFMIGPDL